MIKLKKLFLFSLIFFISFSIYIYIDYRNIFQIKHISIHYNLLPKAIRDKLLDGTSKNIFSIHLNKVKMNIEKILNEKKISKL